MAKERKQAPQADARYFIAYDAGGTMTDCVVVDSHGEVALGKALTNYADESKSFLDSAVDQGSRARVAERRLHEASRPSSRGADLARRAREGDHLPYRIFEMEHLDAGNIIQGPAVLEDPATTLVVPPDRRVRLDEHRAIRFEKN